MPLRNLTFLVVDDLELMRAVTVNELKAMGCQKILSARNGADALRLMRAHKVDMVLSDLNMPVMTGLELLRTLRSDPALQRLPFLMITAEAERERIQEVVAAGVSSLLVKPYSSGSLKARLIKILGDQNRPANVRSAPAAPARSPQVEAVPGAEVPLAPTRILVVDDVPASRMLLERLFRDDYEVETASSGEQALVACARKPLPDLVLMDVMMQGMDGFQTVHQMRERSELAQIPVIFVSGLNEEEAQLKGMALGAVDFVAKNTDPKVLRARVRNFIRFVDLRRRLQADYDAMVEAARLREDVEHITRHDLKGSLAGIVGMVQNLARDEDMAPRHVQQLHMVEQTALQVMNMVNLSSDLYKIETGRFALKPAPVEIGDILHRIVELARNTYSDKQLAVVVDTDTPFGTETPSAVGDAMLCYSLFQNLIKNACEAAPPSSRVVVTLKDETPLRVLIQNTSAVPADMRERFFDKFATSGKVGGSGLGTYSARLLATAQGGNITMSTSDADNSTTLTVTLPRHQFEAPAA